MSEGGRKGTGERVIGRGRNFFTSVSAYLIAGMHARVRAHASMYVCV
jgi:hypothetical protein